MAEKVNLKRKEIIFREGSTENFMYRIRYGLVGIYQNYGQENELKLAQLNEGFLGEMGILENQVRNATAVAIEDTVLEKFTLEEMESYISDKPIRFFTMMQNISERIREMDRKYMEICEKISRYDSEPYVPNSVLPVTASSKTFTDEQQLYQAGEIICQEAVYEDWMYDIHQGKVAVYKNYKLPNEKKLAEIDSGFFGEMSLLNACPRSATIIAVEDTTATMVNTDTFSGYFKERPDRIKELILLLSQRLRKIDDQYKEAYQCFLALEKQDTPEENVKSSIRKFSRIFRRK